MRTQDTSNDETPLARLGGAAGISSVVDELYRRAWEDTELAGYFHRTDMTAQRERLADMITGALGGPSTPWLAGLDEAHAGRGITHRHFSLMAAHLIDTLDHFGVGADEADRLTAWFAAGREAVVDSGGATAAP